jgi:hypothetical protein
MVLETIQRLMLGSIASDDTELTINLINQHLNAAIGYAAKTNYKEEIQLNGIENVSDAFYTSFTNINISKDQNTGWYNATLPQQPAGIGAGWDISGFMLTTGSGAKLFAHPISPREVEFLYNAKKPCNEIFYWVNCDTVSLHSGQDITKYKANVRMISTQSSDLDSVVTIPDGYMPVVVKYLSEVLGIEVQRPIDSSSDGVETPQVR